MRSALGVELRTGRLARAFEDGRTEAVAADAMTDAPDAVALALGDGLDASAWREWVRSRFGYDALEVAEEVARTYGEDIAAGAALWALDGRRMRGAGVVVPPVAGPADTAATDASTMADFGSGRSMDEFGEGREMGDFRDPAQMSDFGEGRQMSDFGDGRSMSEVETGREPAEPAGEPSPEPAAEPLPDPPAKRIPKARLAVAAAVTVAVVALAAIAVAAAGSDDAPEVPVAVTALTTTPEPTTTTTVPAERTFDVSFTITSTNGDQLPGAPLKTGLTGLGTITLTCEDEVCSFDFDRTDGDPLGFVVDDLALDGSSLAGIKQSLAPSQGLHGDCDRQQTRSVTATVSGGSISGDASFTADPITCPGPEQNTIHVYTFTFEGAEPAAVAPSEPEAGTETTVVS